MFLYGKEIFFHIFKFVKKFENEFYWSSIILISYLFFHTLPLLPVINFVARPIALLALYIDEYVVISPVSKSRISTIFGLFRIDLINAYFGSIFRLTGASCFFTESSDIIPLSRSTEIISGLFIYEEPFILFSFINDFSSGSFIFYL